MDPSKLHASLIEKGSEKARTQAYASTTDRLRKQIRAQWVVHHINSGITIGKA